MVLYRWQKSDFEAILGIKLHLEEPIQDMPKLGRYCVQWSVHTPIIQGPHIILDSNKGQF